MSDAATSPAQRTAASALAEARAHFSSGATRSLASRLEALARLDAHIERRADEILTALAEDLGKPMLEAWLSEIHFIRAEIRLVRRRLRRWAKVRRTGQPFFLLPARSEIHREPYGVVLVAAPWNYPFQLSLSPVVTALAAGNTVVLKPSEWAPATAACLARLFEEALPPGWVRVVCGDHELGAALLEQPFDFFFYTGGERVGRLYAEAAARHLAPVVLELGGKCPCLLDESVDPSLAAPRLIAAKFFNAGQTCIAPDFVLVPRARHGEMVEALRRGLETSYGRAPAGDLARIVNEAHYRRLLALCQGACLQVGEDDPAALRLAPRLLPQADWEHPAMQEEIFGPILPVLAYDHLEEALDRLAARPEPLALYAFSRDEAVLQRIAAALRSGAVCFNDAVKQATNLALPFGGIGASGMGRYRGRAGYETFSWTRSLTRRYWCRDPFQTLPPYGGKGAWLRRWMK